MPHVNAHTTTPPVLATAARAITSPLCASPLLPPRRDTINAVALPAGLRRVPPNPHRLARAIKRPPRRPWPPRTTIAALAPPLLLWRHHPPLPPPQTQAIAEHPSPLHSSPSQVGHPGLLNPLSVFPSLPGRRRAPWRRPQARHRLPPPAAVEPPLRATIFPNRRGESFSHVALPRFPLAPAIPEAQGRRPSAADALGGLPCFPAWREEEEGGKFAPSPLLSLLFG